MPLMKEYGILQFNTSYSFITYDVMHRKLELFTFAYVYLSCVHQQSIVLFYLLKHFQHCHSNLVFYDVDTRKFLNEDIATNPLYCKTCRHTMNDHSRVNLVLKLFYGE